MRLKVLFSWKSFKDYTHLCICLLMFTGGYPCWLRLLTVGCVDPKFRF